MTLASRDKDALAPQTHLGMLSADQVKIAPMRGCILAVQQPGARQHQRPRAGDPDPANPGLWFTGFVPGFTGYFDAVATVAERIAAGVVEAGALSRPIRTPEPRIEALSAW